MAAPSGEWTNSRVGSEPSTAPTAPDHVRPNRRWTKRRRWILAIGIAAAVVVAGGGYAIYYEYYAPPFHNIAWQVSNPGSNVYDEVVGDSLYVANVLSSSFPGNSTLLLRSISISSGSINWQTVATVENYTAIPSITALTAESGSIVFANYQMPTWQLAVDFFNETTGQPSGISTYFVGVVNNENLRCIGTTLLFSGVAGASNNSGYTYQELAYSLGTNSATPAWNATVWLGDASGPSSRGSANLLDSQFAVGWIPAFGKVVVTNLSSLITESFTNSSLNASGVALVGGSVYTVLQPTNDSWTVGEFNLSLGKEQDLFSLPGRSNSSFEYNVLYRTIGQFLVGTFCGFAGLSQCGGSLSGYSSAGALRWQVDIGGSINPGSTGYNVFFPTSQTALLVGTPSAYVGPQGTTSSYEAAFVLVDLTSGQVLERVAYGFSLNFPGESPGFGSAPPVTSVYAAAEDKVIYSYGPEIAASAV